MDISMKSLQNKTTVVTGGASGLGEAYVRALIVAGALVVIADRDVLRGRSLEDELTGTKFIECDTTNWDDQVRLFEEAASFSSTGKISFVVANAGIYRQDEVFAYAGDGKQPEKPNLATINVNLIGTLYTSKLASHYFIMQNGQRPSSSQEDTCLVLIGSGAAFLDCPRAPQYCATKWAMRGIMHSLRRTTHFYGSRVNVISPWYVKTNIRSEEDFAHITSVGVQFAETSDASQCLLHILNDSSINGRSYFIPGKKWSLEGYMDLGLEDYQGNLLLESIQKDQVKAAPLKWAFLSSLRALIIKDERGITPCINSNSREDSVVSYLKRHEETREGDTLNNSDVAQRSKYIRRLAH